MTFKTRRLLFYTLLIIFLLLGTGAVLYSSGWRLNPESFHFRKTGAIYIETEPKDAAIKLNNIYFRNRSGLIQKGTLIPNLPPELYKIELKKENYLPYYKNLQVESALVNELINVILIPKEFKKEPLDNSKKIKGSEFVILSNDGNKIVLKDEGMQVYYLYDLNNLSSAFNINVAFSNISNVFDKLTTGISRLVFHPFEPNKLIIETENGLQILDTNRLTLDTVINEQPVAWSVENSSIYYVITTKSSKIETKSYALFSYNLILKTEIILNQESLAIEDGAEIIKIGVDNAGNRIAIFDNFDDIYIFNLSNQELNQIAHSTKSFSFSPDSKKIAFLDRNGKISIHFLEDWHHGINKKAEDVIRLNLENMSEIKDIIWHQDSIHLFVNYGNRIDFIEVDDRPPLNQYTITDQSLPFFYDQENNLIYLIQNNSLWKMRLN
ncbi:MAG: hypothetical protein V3T98_00825 [Candidatus Paceibacterota bacterium]